MDLDAIMHCHGVPSCTIFCWLIIELLQIFMYTFVLWGITRTFVLYFTIIFYDMFGSFGMYVFAVQNFINVRVEKTVDMYAYTDHLREHFRKVWVLHSYTPASPSRCVRAALGQTLDYQGKAIHSTHRHRQYRKPKIIIVIY